MQTAETTEAPARDDQGRRFVPDPPASGELTGQRSVEQRMGITKMVDPFERHDEERTYESHEVRDAAQELIERRKKQQGEAGAAVEAAEKPIVERKYHRAVYDDAGNIVQGDPMGWSPEEAKATGVPLESLDIARASADLTQMRAIEGAGSEVEDALSLLNEVDALRHEAAGLQPPKPVTLADVDGIQQQQAQPVPEPQPAPQPAQTAEEKIRQAMADPQVAAAWQQEHQRVETAERQYREAAVQMHLNSAAHLINDFPELNVDPAHWPSVVQTLRQNSPERLTQLTARVQQHKAVEDVALDAVQRHNANQRQVAAIQQQRENYDAHNWLVDNESPSTIELVQRDGRKVLQEKFGLNRQQQDELLSMPLPASYQKMLYTLVKNEVLARNRPRPAVRKDLPRVMKPGVREPQSIDDHYGVDDARRTIDAQGWSPKTASKMLSAQRRARAARER